MHDDAMDTLAAMLKPSDFYGEAHKILYSALLDRHERGLKCDCLTISHELGDELREFGGIAWLSGLIDGLPRITNLSDWATLVLGHSWRRKLIAMGSALAEKAADSAEEVQELIESASQQLSRISADTGGSVVKLSDILPASVRQIESFVQNRGRVGISTTWDDVDRSMGGGWCGGRMYFLAARSGRGKSSLAMQWAATAAKQGKHVLVFATEMIPEDVGERLLCHQGATDKWAIFRDASEWSRVSLAIGEIQDWPIWIDRRETPTIGQIAATCRQFHLKHGLDMVIIDHVQRLTVDSREGRWLGVGLAVQGLKSLSMRLGIPVLVTSQLSSAEDESKRPHCGMLAQSRQMIEAESDVIGFLHPTSKDWRDELETNLEFFFEKSRHGRCASFELAWNKPTHTMRMIGRTGR
jgi:replicative DNA helicase